MPKLVDEILRAVTEVRKGGTTVLLVEQRLTACMEMANRAYILQTGRVVMAGAAADIARNADVRRVYLGL
jgi:branched-chain amino acid transport system ATP-binding protein